MGHVVGSSTRDGGEPASDRITIPNLYSTIMNTVLDTGTLRTMAGVPPEVQRVIHGADPITQLFEKFEILISKSPNSNFGPLNLFRICPLVPCVGGISSARRLWP